MNYTDYGQTAMTFNPPRMTAGYKKYLHDRYHVLAHICSQDIDHDPIKLEQLLGELRKESFSSDDRIIIEHMDTDYYHPELKHGMFLRNILHAFHEVDIPTYVLLLFTNHFGIKHEINDILIDPNDQPTVIETFIYRPHVLESYEDYPLQSERIIMPAICMMAGTPRSHRHALYDYMVKNRLTDFVAVSKGAKR